MTIPAGTLVPRDARDFGNYQLLAKLATGGMAEIFLARPTGTVKSDVLVLKRILPHLAEDDHFVTMFRDEADLASKLLHKNVCQVMSFGQFAGTWFIAMEYLHGVPLSRMMTRLSKAGKMLDVRVVAGIIVQACEGLHSAHEARTSDGMLMNVVHRDVSPPNIMVCADGTVKLLDFGIAKARGANSRTRTGTVKGKNAYMSPEQILGKPLDRRSDVFALAVVMYEMLSIKRLFHRDSDFLTFKAITEEPIPDIRERRPDLPPAMRAAIIQAMARDPSGRFDSALAFGTAIRNSVANLGGPAAPGDLARLLSSDFTEEMSSRDEILKAADDPNLAPAVSPTGSMPRQQPPPRPSAQPTRSGELATPPPPPPGALSSVPSMLVQQDTKRLSSPAIRPSPTPPPPPPGTYPRPGTSPLAPVAHTPTPTPAASGPIPVPVGVGGTQRLPPLPPPPALPLDVPDMSGHIPRDSWMADGDTNILRAGRRRSIMIVAIGGIALIGLGALAFFLWPTLFPASTDNGDNASTNPITAPNDGGVDRVAPPPDASNDMSRDQIIALSRFGFYSIDASQPTQIYVDDKLIGDTPLTHLPLKPGPHKVKAVGPKGKTKEIKISIIGGRDQDDGKITWPP